MDGVGDPIANSRVSCWHVSCPFSLLVIRQAAVVPCPSIDHVVPRRDFSARPSGTLHYLIAAYRVEEAKPFESKLHLLLYL